MLRLSNNILAIPIVKKGAGPAKSKSVYESELAAIGVESVEDLLLLRAKKYQDKMNIKNFSQIDEKGEVNTFVKVLSIQNMMTKGSKILVEDVQDSSTEYPKLRRATIMAFGRTYLKNYIKVGNIYHLYGDAVRKKDFANSLQITKFDIKPALQTPSGFYSQAFGELKPVFFLSDMFFSNKLQKLCEYVLENLDYGDKSLEGVNKFLKEHSLLSIKEAFYLKLFPKSADDIEKARRTFAAFEISRFSLNSRASDAYTPIPLCDDEKKLISSLPFKLTQSQEDAVIEIISTLSDSSPTQRLLQGEVGSGKTIVLFISAFHEILKKHQVALIAPTEILAFQHYNNALKFFKGTHLRLEFLTSSTKPAERNRILSDLKNGNIDLVIGTHSILASEVQFRDLSLAIIDEEQRFGAFQKENISQKGECVHLLFASATPIPRSIAKVFSNKMSISTLEAISASRLPVKTFIVSPSRRIEAYKTIIPEFEKGHCAYFIVPRIDEDDNNEKMSIGALEEELSSIFKGVPYAVIHSKLKDSQKRDIFTKFMAGDVKYLIATSVVEVGVDNKNATVIFIEDADMFGLSTLHQLRGRVGRGELQSWCFLSYREDITESGKERLRAIKDTNDGFAIAEKDLEQRGSGELLGTRQSGRSLFNYFDIKQDADLID